MRDVGDWVAANDLRAAIEGVDGSQLRNTLNRLIEAGKVQYQGKARWTRYRLA